MCQPLVLSLVLESHYWSLHDKKKFLYLEHNLLVVGRIHFSTTRNCAIPVILFSNEPYRAIILAFKECSYSFNS